MPMPAVFPVTAAKEVLPSRPYGLTRLQHDMMLVLQELYALHGRPPTHREIGAEFDLGPGNVHRVLSALRTRGYIDRLRSQSRSIVIRVPLPFPADFAEERPRIEILRLPEGDEVPA